MTISSQQFQSAPPVQFQQPVSAVPKQGIISPFQPAPAFQPAPPAFQVSAQPFATVSPFQPAPAFQQAPAPAFQQAPAPAFQQAPAPAFQQAPAPAFQQAPAPAFQTAPPQQAPQMVPFQGPPIPAAVTQQFQPIPPQFSGPQPVYQYQQPAYQPWRPRLYNQPTPPGAEQLMLFREQAPHFQTVMKMVNDPRLKYFWDVSEPGTGKSWIEGGLAEAMLPAETKQQMQIKNVPILWLTPKMVKGKVEGFLNRYGLANYGVIAYTEIIGRGSSQPSHGLLIKLQNGQYVASEAFQAIVNTYPGLLLIVDEAHNIKNKTSQQTAAVSALVRATMASPYGLVAFLSATPLDKQQHAYAYLQAIGFMTDEPGKKLASNPFGRGFELGTAGEAIGSIYQVDPQATMRVLAKYGAGINGVDRTGKPNVIGFHDTKTVKAAIHELFRDIVYGPRHSRMIMPKQADVKNLFLYYPKEVIEQLDQLMLGVQQATGYDPRTGTTAKAVEGKSVGQYIKQINNLLMTRIPQWISQFLNENPNYKAVIFTKSKEAVEWAARSLAPWNPIYQTGDTDPNIRQSLMDRFEAPNLQHRIFISTTQTGGIGIDLDDKDGRFPRICLIMPDFSLIDHIQALGRVLRMSTQSVPLLRTVYPINYSGPRLQNITTAVIAKSNTLEEFAEQGEKEKPKVAAKRGKKKAEAAAEGVSIAEEQEDVIEERVNIAYPNQYPAELEPAPPNDGRVYPPAVRQDTKPGL